MVLVNGWAPPEAPLKGSSAIPPRAWPPSWAYYTVDAGAQNFSPRTVDKMPVGPASLL